MKPKHKTPISYYGGKQKLVTTILPLIPEHKLYTEAFCGGGAIFWAKESSQIEVINDVNREIINFYQQLQSNFDELYGLVDASAHSRAMHQDAGVIYLNPHLFSPAQRAWALWMQTNQSFAAKILGGWGYGRTENTAEKKTDNAKARFKEIYSQRLARVQIECGDAIKVIKSRDCADAFHYIDPPYPNTEQGHYSGYTMEHFRHLLDAASSLEGKFLLSCYPNEALDEYTARHGWHTIRKEQLITAAKDRSKGKMKVEVLTANYPI